MKKIKKCWEVDFESVGQHTPCGMASQKCFSLLKVQSQIEKPCPFFSLFLSFFFWVTLYFSAGSKVDINEVNAIATWTLSPLSFHIPLKEATIDIFSFSSFHGSWGRWIFFLYLQIQERHLVIHRLER